MLANSCRRKRWAVTGLVLLLAGGCATPPAPAHPASAPPIRSGAARFWFYRVFFPDDTRGMPAISMNGAPIGYALPGTSFYRDVPAGPYHLSVESDAIDVNQEKDIAVAPGQEVYVKIDSLPSWDTGALSNYRRSAYYVMLPPPHLAALELPQTSYSGDN